MLVQDVHISCCLSAGINERESSRLGCWSNFGLVLSAFAEFYSASAKRKACCREQSCRRASSPEKRCQATCQEATLESNSCTDASSSSCTKASASGSATSSCS